ncbi:hypothetical protein [Deinococcus sp. JMULE3]|uniref:hypothetical protein n=1 Tax=Deinococcus sp. JMULE3 TaxID=2518341 RepID=UPI00157711F0|nr:hypothetical protein [Deinococcus sp. JMULE3]NTX98968.1 hypothetical protein [Deinococcus sp. JMULE3]
MPRDLTLHVLGHTYLSREGRPVPVSAKGAALIAYLTLERRPFHREHLAELLWQSGDALRNLRVELNRLRHLLPDLIPERQPMLELTLPCDLDRWTERAADLHPDEVGEWLSLGTGVPLSGLEDLGSPELRAWVDSQRWRITQVVETQLSSAHARLHRAGQHDAADLIAARVEQLGWALRTEQPQGAELSFTGPDLHRPLLAALRAARGCPQVALLSGRSAQTRREVVSGLAQGQWQSLHVECPPDPDLLLAALLHQLGALLPDSEARLDLLRAPHATRHNTVRLWTLLTGITQPLIIVLNDVTDPALILPHLQVALNLPVDLLLVLCPAHDAARRDLRAALSGTDQSRVHALHLPPLGSTEIMDALAGRQSTWTEERRSAYAARVAMDSDGWEPLARSLLADHTDLGSSRPALLSEARDVLLRDLNWVPVALRDALARLAVAHAPISPSVAGALLDDAPGFLAHAEHLGLLRPCDPVETVHLPQLHYRPADRNDTLCFASEPLRVALAATLSRAARQEIRQQLARTTADPRLAAHYLRLSGQDAPVPAAPGTTLRGVPAPPSDPPPTMPSGPRVECRTGSGYRVILEGGALQVLRHGLYGRPVTLRLPWGPLPPGAWQLSVRVDALRGGPELGQPCYALGFQVGGSALLLGTTPTLDVPVGPRAAYYVAPQGRWVTLRGESPGGPAELQVQAMDVAVTVAHLRVGTATLLQSGARA